jgi:hypothetical protein
MVGVVEGFLVGPWCWWSQPSPKYPSPRCIRSRPAAALLDQRSLYSVAGEFGLRIETSWWTDIAPLSSRVGKQYRIGGRHEGYKNPFVIRWRRLTGRAPEFRPPRLLQRHPRHPVDAADDMSAQRFRSCTGAKRLIFIGRKYGKSTFLDPPLYH